MSDQEVSNGIWYAHIAMLYTVGKLRSSAYLWAGGHDRVFVSMGAPPMAIATVSYSNDVQWPTKVISVRRQRENIKIKMRQQLFARDLCTDISPFHISLENIQRSCDFSKHRSQWPHYCSFWNWISPTSKYDLCWIWIFTSNRFEIKDSSLIDVSDLLCRVVKHSG